METTQKQIVLGILAHVDSGKTTLSEAMLYRAGAIRKLGRVDHGDAFLDTDSLEKARGITIFSKQALLKTGSTNITLLDTPGHVDFSTETERTLQVLDYAVLVISGTDGVQSHTETLWRLLRRYHIPTFVFINKMDLPGADRAALLAVNRTPQMMIATIHGDLPVKKGQKLAGTRIIPLVIEQEKMDAMQAAAGSEPILNVLPMQAKKFAVITTGSEVFKGRIEDKFTPILVGKLAEYGCEMTFHKVCDDDPAGITAAILEAKEAGCELIFTTGGMSVDPDDRTPLAIKNTGADIITYGAPVLPGAMFLVSYLDGVPVCGLPGCVMYAKRTIFDLLLPRLLADDAITAEDIARLGEGGLCLGCAECHWPNCGFGHC